jgi:hypothetical protein
MLKGLIRESLEKLENRMIVENGTPISDGLKYHVTNLIPLSENVFRFESKNYFNLINEVRELYSEGKITLSSFDEELIKTNIGKKGIYEGKEVWLDVPLEDDNIINEAEYKGREVKIGKPMRNSGGGKKYMVYVKDPKSGNVRKISFGDLKGGLTAKVSNPEARKRFAARHNCKDKKDRMTAGYWACRINRFGHLWGGKTYPGYW